MSTSTHHLTRRGALALVCAGSLFLVSACSSSGSGDAAPVTSSTLAAAPAAESSDVAASDAATAGDTGPSDIEQGLEDAGLGSKGAGLVYAMEADRYEVVGDELHVYLGDKTTAPEGAECIIATAVLSPGETVIIHRGDTVTPCE